jgi:hypothetical protein
MLNHIVMRNIVASLLALLGTVSPAQTQQKPGNVDLSTILYSTPTLSDDIAALEPISGQPKPTELIFHEDEWSQVEFLPKSQLREVQRLLKEYKPFEQTNRTAHGWRKVYVRKLHRLPIVSGSQALRELEHTLGVVATPGPILSSAGSASGRVRNGFTLPLGGNVSLYGYLSAGAVPVLGAYVGESPDDQKLTQAFMRLNSKSGAILVDWRAQVILVSMTATGKVEVWRP